MGLNVQDLPSAVGLTGDIGREFRIGEAGAVDTQLAILHIQIGGKAALPGQKPVHLGIAKAEALASGCGRDMGAVQGAGQPNLGGCGAAIAAAQQGEILKHQRGRKVAGAGGEAARQAAGDAIARKRAVRHLHAGFIAADLGRNLGLAAQKRIKLGLAGGQILPIGIGNEMEIQAWMHIGIQRGHHHRRLPQCAINTCLVPASPPPPARIRNNRHPGPVSQNESSLKKQPGRIRPGSRILRHHREAVGARLQRPSQINHRHLLPVFGAAHFLTVDDQLKFIVASHDGNRPRDRARHIEIPLQGDDFTSRWTSPVPGRRPPDPLSRQRRPGFARSRVPAARERCIKSRRSRTCQLPDSIDKLFGGQPFGPRPGVDW